MIVPVYNRPKLLEEAVASALGQTYRPIEVLVVDDGSTDETLGVAERLACRHPMEVRLLRQANVGPGAARETGRLAARGEFIQYLDSDDLLMPRKFELQVAALRQRPDAGLAYGINEVLQADGSVDTEDRQTAGRALERMFPDFLERRFWHTGAALLQRETSDAAGPWSDLRLEEDWEYDCRIAALDRPLVFVPEVVIQTRAHAGNRIGGGAALDPRRLASRARAHELILSHARRAGVRAESPEMARFARALFFLARQCGAARLSAESRRLFDLARRASTPERSMGIDFRLYGLLAALVGWHGAGRLALLVDALRSRRGDFR